jgi:hypothetical protein
MQLSAVAQGGSQTGTQSPENAQMVAAECIPLAGIQADDADGAAIFIRAKSPGAISGW